MDTHTHTSQEAFLQLRGVYFEDAHTHKLRSQEWCIYDVCDLITWLLKASVIPPVLYYMGPWRERAKRKQKGRHTDR